MKRAKTAWCRTLQKVHVQLWFPSRVQKSELSHGQGGLPAHLFHIILLKEILLFPLNPNGLFCFPTVWCQSEETISPSPVVSSYLSPSPWSAFILFCPCATSCLLFTPSFHPCALNSSAILQAIFSELQRVILQSKYRART